jgi:hypothetical protein
MNTRKSAFEEGTQGNINTCYRSSGGARECSVPAPAVQAGDVQPCFLILVDREIEWARLWTNNTLAIHTYLMRIGLGAIIECTVAFIDSSLMCKDG